MIPGIIPIGAFTQDPQTFQFSRTEYNAGFVYSGSVTLNIKSIVPYVIAGDNLRMDALWWAGSWCDLWKDRVAFYFKYGTPYSVPYISGNSGKDHYLQFTYSGGETVTLFHSYNGDPTSFPNAEVSIDRLIWFGVQNLPFNYFVKSLPA